MSLRKIISKIAQADRSGKRAPRPKAGEIRLKWGKMQYEDPDLIVSGGPGTGRADRSLVMFAITSKQPPSLLRPDVWEPSLAEELHRRGYDLTTLEFRISKKGASDATDPTR